MTLTEDGRLFDVPATGPERPAFALNLVGSSDIAQALGLSPERVRQLEAVMPAPVGCIGRHSPRRRLVWLWEDIEAWAASEGRKIEQAPP